jgi:hypothetical protein
VLTLNLLLTAALLAADPFSARPLDGDAVSGEVTALNGKQLVLKTEKGPVTLDIAKLAMISGHPVGDDAAGKFGVTVELGDGSVLLGAGFTSNDGVSSIAGVSEQKISTSQLRSVYFATAEPPTPKLAKQWAEITASKAAGDLLVVRKNDSFDYLEGIIKGVDAENCQFEIDGEVIPVKRAKVAGLVYARHGDEPAEPAAKLATTSGARMNLRSFELIDGELKGTLAGGTEFEVPLDQVARLDFSTGKIAYLSDLDPEEAVFTPLVGFSAPPQGLLGYFNYRRDVGFDQSPLRLDGKEFRKGLSLASRTSLAYKLPGKFRVFRATVGIDDSTRETGNVHLEISGDGKVLWQGEVRGDEPSQQLELEIGGVKRLLILADYGAGLDVGDRLDLGEAQISK